MNKNNRSKISFLLFGILIIGIVLLWLQLYSGRINQKESSLLHECNGLGGIRVKNPVDCISI